MKRAQPQTYLTLRWNSWSRPGETCCFYNSDEYMRYVICELDQVEVWFHTQHCKQRETSFCVCSTILVTREIIQTGILRQNKNTAWLRKWDASRLSLRSNLERKTPRNKCPYGILRLLIAFQHEEPTKQRLRAWNQPASRRWRSCPWKRSQSQSQRSLVRLSGC